MVAVNGFDAPSSELDNNNDDDDDDDDNDDDGDDRKLYELTEDKSDIVEDEGIMQLGGAVATPSLLSSLVCIHRQRVRVSLPTMRR